MKKAASGYRLIFGYLGIFLILIGIICLLPLLMLIAYPEEINVLWSFVIPGASAIVCGIPLSFLILHRDKMQLAKFQDSILLVSIWLLAILVGAIPFLLRGFQNGGVGSMSFTDAIFESTSGYSSSGLTVFDFNESLPGYHVFTTYRSILLLFGGIGLVLIVTSTISDRYGLKLYTAEGHNDKLMPNLAKSARLILAIYLGYIVLGTLSYWLLGGMELFDSFNHAVAAVATGGFSTKAGGLPKIIQAGGNNSITGMPINEVAINVTSIVLMILGATNFVLHLFLFRGKFKKIFKDCEIRFFATMCIIFIPLFFVCILRSGLVIADNPLLALSDGTFLFFSSITTTGFSTVSDINKLGSGAILLSSVMMSIGGGMGSTAGAIKQQRIVVILKDIYWSIRDRTAPKNKYFPHIINRLGESREVAKEEVYESAGYAFLYICVLVGGSVALLISTGGEYSVAYSFFEFTSALSGTGLTIGLTAGINTISGVALSGARLISSRWILIVGMFAGRLEITCIYFAFYRIIRDLFRKETV